jgi:hypothetical protein
MSSFQAIATHSAVATLLFGLTTGLGCLGMGDWILAVLVPFAPTIWRIPAAMLTGIQLLALCVFIAGISGVASPALLLAIWFVFVALGATRVLLVAPSPRTINVRGRYVFLLIAVPLLLNLAVAVCPSTKSDEVYYHMLVPSRIVADGALRFYREPVEAAIVPQMTFQIAHAPLHAAGQPDAANVTSWCFSILLAIVCIAFMNERTESPEWSALGGAAIVYGAHSTVWYVTGGAHAMGDLAVVCASLALFALWNDARDARRTQSLAICISLFALAAYSAKVSLAPVAGLCMVLAWWRARGPRNSLRIALLMSLPWALFALPVLIWTYRQSGSPFGPLFAGWFGRSVYPAGIGRELMAGIQERNKQRLTTFLPTAFVSYVPLLWIFIVTGVLLNRRRRAMLILLALFVVQLIVVASFLPYEFRFLSGLQFAIAVIGVMELARRRISKPLFATAIVMLLPWFGLQLYYARPFVSLLAGVLSPTEYYRRYVAFVGDFERLDGLLPQDARLLVKSDHDVWRIPSVYSPRPVVFSLDDVDPAPSYLFFISTGDPINAARYLHQGRKLGRLVYANPSAIGVTFRTPGRPFVHEQLHLYEIARP